tara:strand:- start:991 stop:1962 length:972 start_codon:yes stop_codon:yes gene_type:complete
MTLFICPHCKTKNVINKSNTNINDKQPIWVCQNDDICQYKKYYGRWMTWASWDENPPELDIPNNNQINYESTSDFPDTEDYFEELEYKYLKKTKKKPFLIPVLIIFISVSVYSYNLINTERLKQESCDNFLSTWNQLDSLENEYIFLNNQTVEIWNLYVDYQLTDDYLNLTSDKQKEVHTEMNLYKLKTLLTDETDVILELNNIFIDRNDIHETHNDLLNLFNDVHNLTDNKLTLINENTINTVDYVTQIEKYFEEWDTAKNANNAQLANDLDYRFWEIYDKEWTQNFQQNNIEINEISNLLIQKVNSYTDLSLSLCDHSFDD